MIGDITSKEETYIFEVPTAVLIAVRATNKIAAKLKLKNGETLDENTDARDYNSAEFVDMG